MDDTEFRELFLSRTFWLLEQTDKNFAIYLNALPKSSDRPADRLPRTAELQAYCDVLLLETARWREEMKNRIAMTFGVDMLQFEKKRALAGAHRPSRADFLEVEPKVTVEAKCSYLLRLLAVSIPDYGYDSRMICVLQDLRMAVGLPPRVYLYQVETQLAEEIKRGALEEQQSLEAQNTASGTLRRNVMVGMGAAAGAVALGITAGFAAPVMIPLFASLMGFSAGAAALTSTTSAALFGVVFGAGGAGFTGYRVGRRYRNVKDFLFLPVVAIGQMRVALGISGWVSEEADVRKPWSTLCTSGVDVFVLECDKVAFRDLGRAMQDFITSSAISYTTMEVLRTTALATALAALVWPIAVIQAGLLIDNPWSVCMNIAHKAGLILADAIRNRAHGHRPITLVGFSLGALVIFECLQELGRDPRANVGIVEHVVIFGLPARIHPVERWQRARMLVAGRFIHCYSKKDWVLRFLYRTTSLTLGDIAGLNPIEHVHGIENVNMSNFVRGHLEYGDKVAEMVELLGL